MTDPVRPVAPRIEIERIYQKAQSAALDWKLQSDESCDLIDDLLVACEAYFAAAPVPCAASSPADVVEIIELVINSLGDVEQLGDFAPTVNASRWAKSNADHLRSAINKLRATGEGVRDSVPIPIAEANARLRGEATVRVEE